MRSASGAWEGLSVDLWRTIAERLDIEFEWRETPLEQTLSALQRGEVDLAIAALSVTADRETVIDFSHPYYVTGLSPAFAADHESPWLATLRRFVSIEFLSAVGSLALVLLVAGFLVWVFERRANADQFGRGGVARGIGDGFWWSAVTMTTVGYGDKAPVSAGGRAVALVWMFASLIIIASFTASITASLTATELSQSQLRDKPLSRLRIGVLRGSAAEEYALSHGLKVGAFEALGEGLAAVAGGQVDTLVHDAPILRYAVRSGEVNVEIDPRILVRDDYAFAFPPGSGLREAVNLQMLDFLYEPAWQRIKARYLGSDEGQPQ
jgi:ABC-type amino acid transport substrate-binding protein